MDSQAWKREGRALNPGAQGGRGRAPVDWLPSQACLCSSLHAPGKGLPWAAAWDRHSGLPSPHQVLWTPGPLLPGAPQDTASPIPWVGPPWLWPFLTCRAPHLVQVSSG